VCAFATTTFSSLEYKNILLNENAGKNLEGMVILIKKGILNKMKSKKSV
jgi:hypothetical protein